MEVIGDGAEIPLVHTNTYATGSSLSRPIPKQDCFTHAALLHPYDDTSTHSCLSTSERSTQDEAHLRFQVTSTSFASSFCGMHAKLQLATGSVSCLKEAPLGELSQNLS